MPVALAVTLPLVLAAVLIASGIAKLRHPDDLAGWTQMGVPARLRRPWLLSVHPWAEVALGTALAVLGGVLGLLAALIGLALMVAYLVMVARVVSGKEDASCSCFGTRKSVTRVTVWRNAWLTLVAAGAVAVIWVLPLWGGTFAVGAWWWMLGLAVAAATVAFVMWPEPERPTAPASSASAVPAADGELDYMRTRTPAVPVTLADGDVISLRQLTASKPLLLLAVSETCGSCDGVIARIEEWRDRLPEVDIRFLLQAPPESSRLTSDAEPQTLHDVHGYVRESIAQWPTPTAVLFGTDGMLAGGPVSGDEQIAGFVDDMDDALHGGVEATLTT